MKSSFGRSFFTAAAILLVAMTILGASFQIKVNQFLTDTTVSGLQQNADTIAELAAAYFNNGGMYNRSFQLNLTVASQVSGADAVVCDSEGNVVLCSDAPSGCEHQGLQLNQAYLQKVIRSGGDTATGVINGLYSDRRYMVSRPILVDGNAGGIVLVSTPANDITQIMNKISNIFLTAALFVVLISVLAVTAFARRESRPLKELAKTANAFGHGDLEARVRLDDDYSEEMEEVAVAFNNMAASLQKSEYRRQEFVANVSHELKTPMTTISGYVDGILDGTIPEDKQEHYLHIVSDETKRLSRLVRSMLDISQLQKEGGIPEEKKMHFDLEECRAGAYHLREEDQRQAPERQRGYAGAPGVHHGEPGLHHAGHLQSHRQRREVLPRRGQSGAAHQRGRQQGLRLRLQRRRDHPAGRTAAGIRPVPQAGQIPLPEPGRLGIGSVHCEDDCMQPRRGYFRQLQGRENRIYLHHAAGELRKL